MWDDDLPQLSWQLYDGEPADSFWRFARMGWMNTPAGAKSFASAVEAARAVLRIHLRATIVIYFCGFQRPRTVRIGYFAIKHTGR